MLDLTFQVAGVAVVPNAAAPTLVFDLHVSTTTDEPVHALMLRSRIVIDAHRRRYSPAEEERLTELFGDRDQWRNTLRGVPWADVSTAVPGFDAETTVKLSVPCTYDMEVASTKYLHGVDDADIPLGFQFSGTAFVRGPAGIGIVQLPRDLDAAWRMPAGTWGDLMKVYFPDSRWLRLRDDAFESLARYKAARALPTWDAAVDELLQLAAAPLATS